MHVIAHVSGRYIKKLEELEGSYFMWKLSNVLL